MKHENEPDDSPPLWAGWERELEAIVIAVGCLAGVSLVAFWVWFFFFPNAW